MFDGVIEGMHQHWKHREVVKVITMQRRISQVLFTAKSLERESGGILVSVDKLKEGHAIIIYRGKNYSRPHKLVHDNLLSKREALHRSLLMQRIGVSKAIQLIFLTPPTSLVFFLIILLCFLVTVVEVFCVSETDYDLRFETQTGNIKIQLSSFM